jgi:hypothetical protein
MSQSEGPLVLVALNQAQLHQTRRQIGGSRICKVRQVDSAGRLALLRPRLGQPEAIVRETGGEVAKADFRPEFRGQSSETIGAAPRTDAAGDSDDDKGGNGRGNPGCPWSGMFLVCSDDVKPPSAARFPHGFSVMLAASRK